MKLLYCKECRDVISLKHYKKYCGCGKSYGKYIDNYNSVYGGNSVCIALDNASFYFAIENQMIDGSGVKIDASVIPLYSAATIKANKINCANFNQYTSSIVALDWNKKLKYKRTFPFSILYKIAKKIVEINIDDSVRYSSLTDSIEAIKEKLFICFGKSHDQSKFVDNILWIIEQVAIKNQGFVKYIGNLSTPQIISKAFDKYEYYYGRIPMSNKMRKRIMV